MTSPNHAPVSPDTTPSRGPEYIDKLPDPMQIDMIDEMRIGQGEYVDQAVRDAAAAKGESLDDAEEQQIRNDAVGEFDEKIKERLIAGGVTEDNPNFASYASTLRALSLDKISHTEWVERRVDPDDSSKFLPSKRTVAADSLQAVADTLSDPATPDNPDPDNPDNPDNPDTPPAVESHRNDAENFRILIEEGEYDDDGNLIGENLRSKLAKLSAKRQGRLWTSKKGRHEYEEVEEKYNYAVKQRIKHELAAKKLEGMPNDELRAEAALQLLQEQSRLRLEATENLKNTKISGFIRKLTSGGVVKRIIKGAALGAGVGAIGVLTGGIGAGVAGAVAIAPMVRFARSYAAFDNKAGRGMQTLESADRSDAVDGLQNAGVEGDLHHDETVDKVQGYLAAMLESDTKGEQKKRRRSVRRASYMVGAGAIAGAMIHGAVDLWPGGNTHASGPHHGGGSGADGGTTHGGGNGNEHFPGKQSDHGGNAGDGANGGHDTDAGSPDHYTSSALKMSRGEGLFSTFKSLDIPQKDWSELLEKSGPELHEMKVDGMPLTYRMPNGQWGLNMTPDGKFPTKGLDKIVAIHDTMK